MKHAKQFTRYLLAFISMLLVTILLIVLLADDGSPSAFEPFYSIKCFTDSGKVFYYRGSHQRPVSSNGTIAYKNNRNEWVYVMGNCVSEREISDYDE